MRAISKRWWLLLGLCASCRCAPRRAVHAVRRAAFGVTEVPSAPTSQGTPRLAGCALFPPDNPWNQEVVDAPLDPGSDAYIANIQAHGQGNLHPDFGSNRQYGIPFTTVPANQPMVPIRFTEYGDESDPGPYPIPPDAPVEGGNDHHILVLQAGTCRLYELYHAERDGEGWAAGSGAVFDLARNETRTETWTSCDQAGLPILPGLVRYDEVAAGVIRHALRVTFDHTQAAWIPPATHPGGDEQDIHAPPMGLRLRLKRGYDISQARGAARVILKALQQYGAFVADTGTNWYISGATDPRWNDADLDQLRDVPGTAFEVVRSGPLRRR